jgi:NDP-sugar pyrophosphorylase family protein
LTPTDALILCGGLGTRLRPLIPDRPKGLAIVGGKPVLDILVDDLLNQGFRRIILCVGYLREQIVDRFDARKDAEFVFSREVVPLGTGGAVRNAIPLVSSDLVLIMNGDSICPFAFSDLLAFHTARNATASIVVTRADERHDGGIVALDDSGRIRSFLEKPDCKYSHGSFINAGIYLLRRECTMQSPMSPPFSLERDIFPSLVSSSPCFGFVVNSKLEDIGTPERYLAANKLRE